MTPCLVSVAYGKNADGKLFTDVNPDFAKQLIKPLRIWAKANLYSESTFQSAFSGMLGRRLILYSPFSA